MSMLFGAVFASVLAVAAPVEDRVRFEAMGGKLKFFPAGDMAYDRPGVHFVPKNWAADWTAAREEIVSRNNGVPDLLRLLADKNPKVRTLALAALFQREDPKLLPAIAGLMQDQEKTFPRPVPFAAPFLFDGEKKLPPVEDQTVGQVARLFVRFWMEQAYWQDKDFAAYWALRKDRAFCSSWFRVRMARALQGSSTFDKTRADRVRAIRKDIERLPPLDRDWTLLWLGSISTSEGSPEGVAFLVKPDDMLQAGKRLGPARLMDLLQGKAISSDPDLGTDPPGLVGRRVLSVYVLKNATALLRAEDGPTLLTLEDAFRSPWWTIASAELQPAKARKLLTGALGRFGKETHFDAWKRAELAAALWKICGEEESGFLVNWFYGEKVDLNPSTTQTEIFLTRIAGVRAPADRKLLARLIADKRFDNLDYQSLRGVVLTVQRWTKEPVLPQEEIYNGRYWRGENRDGLAAWRRKLKESVPLWNK